MTVAWVSAGYEHGLGVVYVFFKGGGGAGAPRSLLYCRRLLERLVRVCEIDRDRGGRRMRMLSGGESKSPNLFDDFGRCG